jgi:hypothetical protein
MQMRLVSFYNKQFEKLAERFSRSIKDDVDMVLHFIPEKGIGWCGGQDIQLRKTELILQELNFAEPVIFADIDIQFFRPFVPHLPKSSAFQFEFGEVRNIGFMLLYRDTVPIWEAVAQEVAEGVHDQQVVQRFTRLDQFLPKSFWAYHPKSPNPPADIVLHHATWALSESDKLAQMDSIKNKVLSGMIG